MTATLVVQPAEWLWVAKRTTADRLSMDVFGCIRALFAQPRSGGR
jgi:hypothetical protein